MRFYDQTNSTKIKYFVIFQFSLWDSISLDNHADFVGITFNSLYEIHDTVWITLDAKTTIFQFSLWDSVPIRVQTFNIPPNFQFSLWDSIISLSCSMFRFFTFNSLYEIPALALLLSICMELTFNSLYEILSESFGFP